MVSTIDAKVFRSDSTQGIGSMFFLMTAFIFIAGTEGLNGGVQPSASLKVVSVIVMIIALVLAWWSIFYVARQGVFATKDGILIRNWFRRRFIAWPDLDAFEFGTDTKNLTIRENLASPFLQTYAI